LKSSGDKASPCFRPFWIGKLSDKCLPKTDNLTAISEPIVQKSVNVSQPYQPPWPVTRLAFTQKSIVSRECLAVVIYGKLSFTEEICKHVFPVMAFLDVTLCRFVDSYQYSRGTCYL
jgi:hypothetical protein